MFIFHCESVIIVVRTAFQVCIPTMRQFYTAAMLILLTQTKLKIMKHEGLQLKNVHTKAN